MNSRSIYRLLLTGKIKIFTKKSKDFDTILEQLQKANSTNEELQSQIETSHKQLEEKVAEIKQLERQIALSNDNNQSKWSDVVSENAVLVKGESNPLSNFYPCEIPFMNHVYASVEHGYR